MIGAGVGSMTASTLCIRYAREARMRSGAKCVERGTAEIGGTGRVGTRGATRRGARPKRSARDERLRMRERPNPAAGERAKRRDGDDHVHAFAARRESRTSPALADRCFRRRPVELPVLIPPYPLRRDRTLAARSSSPSSRRPRNHRLGRIVGPEDHLRRDGPVIGFFCRAIRCSLPAAAFRRDHGVSNVWWLGLLLMTASILGNTVGYAIGKATGPRLFTREDSLLFNKKHLYRAHEFYERHGGKTIIIARFMPIVRTFVPVVAGMGQMGYRRYTFYNVVGGIGWIWGMLLIGYFLGTYIPGVDQHIESVIIIVVLLSLMPGIIGWLKAKRDARNRPSASS